MGRQKWEWGPVGIGIFKGLLWATVLIGFTMPRVLFWYVPLLVFLGLGLKPVLEVTGFGALLVNLVEKRQAKRWKRIEEQERLKVKQKQRDDKYRHQRVRDPRLPKNW